MALALLGTLTGCGGSDEPTSTPSTTPTSSTAPASPDATASSPSSAPSASATAEAPATQTGCGSSRAVPDGTWQGPITVTMRGNGGKGYDDAEGTGRLTLTVNDGNVTSGRWTLAWESHGEAQTDTASASIDLSGTVRGSARGTARKPVLPHSWRLKGNARVTRPQVIDSPINETGSGSAPLKVTASSCDRVEGTFVPSVTSKDAVATFTGTATWVATRR